MRTSTREHGQYLMHVVGMPNKHCNSHRQDSALPVLKDWRMRYKCNRSIVLQERKRTSMSHEMMVCDGCPLREQFLRMNCSVGASTKTPSFFIFLEFSTVFLHCIFFLYCSSTSKRAIVFEWIVFDVVVGGGGNDMNNVRFLAS